MKSILFIGMDVHKNSYSLCCYDKENGEISREIKCVADVKLVKKYIEGIKKEAGKDTVIKCGYETGCLGFSLYKSLKTLDIFSTATMQYSPKNKAVKTDKMDARNIAINLANNTYKAVYIPDNEDLRVKEYIRMTNSFKKQLKKVK